MVCPAGRFHGPGRLLDVRLQPERPGRATGTDPRRRGDGGNVRAAGPAPGAGPIVRRRRCAGRCAGRGRDRARSVETPLRGATRRAGHHAAHRRPALHHRGCHAGGLRLPRERERVGPARGDRRGNARRWRQPAGVRPAPTRCHAGACPNRVRRGCGPPCRALPGQPRRSRDPPLSVRRDRDAARTGARPVPHGRGHFVRAVHRVRERGQPAARPGRAAHTRRGHPHRTRREPYAHRPPAAGRVAAAGVGRRLTRHCDRRRRGPLLRSGHGAHHRSVLDGIPRRWPVAAVCDRPHRAGGRRRGHHAGVARIACGPRRSAEGPGARVVHPAHRARERTSLWPARSRCRAVCW